MQLRIITLVKNVVTKEKDKINKFLSNEMPPF